MDVRAGWSRAGAIAAVLIAIGGALHVGSIDDGLLLDDRIYTRLIAAHLQGREVPGQWYELAGVRYPNGAADIAREIEAGRLPWWTDPEGAWAMFRPTAVVTHYLDALLWGSAAAPMHAHNLLWQAALLAAAFLLYRRLCGGDGVALLALGLCAASARNPDVVSWVATRNAIMMATLAVLAVYWHDRGVRGAGRWGAPLSALCLLLALWSSEGAVCVWGALLGHALWMDSRRPAERLRSLAAPLAVTVGWQVHYRWLGFGARGGSLYLDPIADPLAFVSAAPGRVLAMGQQLWGVPSPPGAPFAQALAACSVAVLLLLCRRSSTLRVWLLAAVAATLPLSAGPPSDRVLLFPGLCADAAIATACWQLWSLRGRAMLPARALAVAWVGVRVAAGIAAVPEAGTARAAADATLSVLTDSMPPARDDGPARVVLNTPNAVATAFALALSADAPFAPGRHHVLGESMGPVQLSRPAPDRLRLYLEAGYPLGGVYRAAGRRMAVGARHRVGSAELTVEAVTDDGRPQAIGLHWPSVDRLEDLSVAWIAVVHHRDGRLRSIPIPLPPVGGGVALSAHAR